MQEIGLYLIITNPVLPYRQIAEICVKKGIRMLQLRQKKVSDRELLAAANELVAATRGSQTKIIINDRPDITVLSKADGMHLGQDDLPIEEARKILPKGTIIGLSTHSIEQAKQALAQKPDYIGFGPVFATTTKEIPDPVVGTQQLKQVLGFADVPVVAIGGIFPDNLGQVLAAGAKTVCLVRHLMCDADLEQKIDALQQTIEEGNI